MSSGEALATEVEAGWGGDVARSDQSAPTVLPLAEEDLHLGPPTGPVPIGEEGPVVVERLPEPVAAEAEPELRGQRGFGRLVVALVRWTLLASAAGLVAAAGAAVFVRGLDAMIGVVDGVRAVAPWWSIALFPAAGGLLVGYLLWRTDRVAFVSVCGTDSFIDAVEEAEGRIPARVPILRMIGAWLTIGFGGSSGRECPMIYTGAGLGSTVGGIVRRIQRRVPPAIANRIELSVADTRLLALCGAAGALGAIFSAPIGGAVFAVEVPYRRDIDLGVIWPALVSSTVGFAVGRLLIGRQLLLHLPVLHSFSAAEWALIAVIAVAASLLGRLFAVIFNGYHSLIGRVFHDRSRLPVWTQTGIGGLLAGVIMLAFPQVYGIGLDAMRDAVSGKLFSGHALAVVCLLFAGLTLAKLLATTFTVGSRGVGGLLFPSMFAGAALGGAAAALATAVAPHAFPHHEVYVVVAMGATYAAAGNVPIASMLMIAEATTNFSIMAPLFVANLLAYALSGKSSVYDVQREARRTEHRRLRYPLALVLVGMAVVGAHFGLLA